MFEKLSHEAERILEERFGEDCIISLATSNNNIPYVRNVNAFYEHGAFYVLTYALSDKIKQIAENPIVAISGEWFSAHGKGIDLGWFGKDGNKAIAAKMRSVFARWIDNGHCDFEDKNTIILKIELTDGILMSYGTRYEIDFTF